MANPTSSSDAIPHCGTFAASFALCGEKAPKLLYTTRDFLHEAKAGRPVCDACVAKATEIAGRRARSPRPIPLSED